jgi:hypothetical protein
MENMSGYKDIKDYEKIFLRTVEPSGRGLHLCDRNRFTKSKFARLRVYAKLRTVFKFKLKRFELN